MTEHTPRFFPVSFEHDGDTWHRTGKECRYIATGEAAAEYRSITRPGWLVWRTTSGAVQRTNTCP